MKKIALASAFLLALTLLAASLILAAARTAAPLYDGPELDYQPSIIRRQPDAELLVVLERISLPSFHGDLYASRTIPGSTAWPTPYPILDSALNERHPSLVQAASDSFLLFYLVDETNGGAYRLHRATSSAGIYWTDRGALDLGWLTPGEINPHVIREADGTLTMTYHRLSGPSYIAQSHDDGATWDKLKTQISPANAQLPRIAKRESDGLYLVTYQVGSSNLDLYAKTTTDPYDWSGPQIPVSTDDNTHDSAPIVLEDGAFLVAYAKTPVNYFDVFYRTSCDGETWGAEVQVTHDPSRYDTQPHPLLQGTPGRLILAWPHQDGATPYQDHDVWIDDDLALQAAPNLAASVKQVSPAAVAPTGQLTYTLVLSNDSLGYGQTTARLADPIPASTAYDGGLWASSGRYGYDPVAQAITWTGVLSSCSQVTLGFRVSITPDMSDGDFVTNTAWLSDDLGAAYALVATATVDGLPPASAILDPQAGQFLSSTAVLVSGVASDTASGVAQVAVSVDGGAWQLAAGQAAWTYQTPPLADGAHNLRSRATDAAGHVEAPGPGLTVTLDATPPQVAAARPVSGAADVPLTATIVLTFSEPVVTRTLAYTLAPDPGGWAVAWRGDETVATLSHAGLAPGQTYTFTLTQARDRARNPLAPLEWAFTTAPRYRIYLPLVLKKAPTK